MVVCDANSLYRKRGGKAGLLHGTVLLYLAVSFPSFLQKPEQIRFRGTVGLDCGGLVPQEDQWGTVPALQF